MRNSCGTFFYSWRIQLSVFKEVADSSQAQPPSPPVEKFFPTSTPQLRNSVMYIHLKVNILLTVSYLKVSELTNETDD